MKKFISAAIFVVAISSSLFAQQINQVSMVSSTEARKTSHIATALPIWESTQFNFGKIAKGKPVSTTFVVKNNGDAPLILQNVKPSCGCTTDDFTKEAIAPGQSGFVKLTYNAANVGVFTKSTIVTSNAATSTINLLFSGEVIAE